MNFEVWWHAQFFIDIALSCEGCVGLLLVLSALHFRPLVLEQKPMEHKFVKETHK
jgi:hypothetical protein